MLSMLENVLFSITSKHALILYLSSNIILRFPLYYPYNVLKSYWVLNISVLNFEVSK